MGIFVGLRCGLELFLGVCLCVGQCSIGLGHQCRLDTNVSDDRSSTVAFKDEPPSRVMPRGRRTHRDLGNGTRNHVSGRRSLRLRSRPRRDGRTQRLPSEGGPRLGCNSQTSWLLAERRSVPCPHVIGVPPLLEGVTAVPLAVLDRFWNKPLTDRATTRRVFANSWLRQ